MEVRSNNKAKHRSQKIAFGLFRLLSLCIVLILFVILGFIIYKGIGAISWEEYLSICSLMTELISSGLKFMDLSHLSFSRSSQLNI